MEAIAVIGAHYGDEGKGLMVDYLARQNPEAVVVRFNGGAQAGLTRHQIQRFMGRALPRNVEDDRDQGQDSYVVSPELLLAEAERTYHCYHIMVAQGDHARRYKREVRESWTALMGDRAVWLTDYHSLAEVIISLIELNEGRDKGAIVNSWSGGTQVAVVDALQSVIPAAAKGSSVVRF